MPAILTPALVLRHLRELSTDVRAAVALAPDGRVLGGDAAIAEPARGLVDAAGPVASIRVDMAAGVVLMERAPHAVFVVVAGPHALVDLLSHDLETLVRDTHDEPQEAGPAVPAGGEGADSVIPPALEAAARALISA